MRWLAIGLGALVLAGASDARPVHVRGHVTRAGRYIAPHMRTSPNRTRLDNYSTRGNVNPYTAKAGSKSPIKP